MSSTTEFMTARETYHTELDGVPVTIRRGENSILAGEAEQAKSAFDQVGVSGAVLIKYWGEPAPDLGLIIFAAQIEYRPGSRRHRIEPASVKHNAGRELQH